MEKKNVDFDLKKKKVMLLLFRNKAFEFMVSRKQC